ncbi:DNA polymerase III subunit delta' C-terminal domain-containing protein [Candidatus Providencia siddallii]|uniref:DNA polymerase III subunit delta' n=1 Tax=Candidatus Providencia siddallii TaxID=1715285 RepID=A0ABM9NP87_9GAMM
MINLYPWLNDIYKQLIINYKKNMMHYALLLHSISGNGCELLCNSIINWLFCKNKINEKSCNKCHNCNLILLKNHPDFYTLESESKNTKINIDLTRKIIEKFNNYQHQDNFKILYIPYIEKLNDECINILLKMLENPKKNIFYILKCEKKNKLFKNIRNRCFYFFLKTPNQKNTFYWLKTKLTNINKINAITAIKLSNNAPFAALNLLQSNNWLKRKELCCKLKNIIQQGDLLDLLNILNTNNPIKMINWLLTLLLDAIKLHNRINKFCINYDQKQLLLLLVNKINKSQLIILYKQWQICNYQLLTIPGLNQELIIINQLIKWKKLNYKI